MGRRSPFAGGMPTPYRGSAKLPGGVAGEARSLVATPWGPARDAEHDKHGKRPPWYSPAGDGGNSTESVLQVMAASQKPREGAIRASDQTPADYPGQTHIKGSRPRQSDQTNRQEGTG